MRHMLMSNNIGLITTRQVTNLEFCHVSCTKSPIELKMCSHDRSTNLFPLYLYSHTSQATLFDAHSQSGVSRQPNIAAKFITTLANLLHLEFISNGTGDLQETFGPEDAFSYTYAILHSPTYRSRYAAFLKIDFPRLPLTSNSGLFRDLCNLGEQLVGLHLMEKFGKVLPKYPIKGNDLVEKIEYLEPEDQSEQGRVYISKMQYFDGVPSEVWNFHIGGYQVCHKWLKDRKGRTLSFDDVQHYQRIVSALDETIQIMEQIDETIEEHGGWPLE